MTSFRRHLASMGLAVVLCHMVMQVLVPAALCCQTAAAASKAAAKECCAAGAHTGQPCPMHKNRTGKSSSSDRECGARSQMDLHDLFIALTSGGIIPSLSQLGAPAGSEAAPMAGLPYAPFVADAILGPPPRA